MNINVVRKVDKINTLLLFVSALFSILFPFHTFLFSFAFLGPIHYLTEISWLGKKNYFTKDEKYLWVAVLSTLFITIFPVVSVLGKESTTVLLIAIIISTTFLMAILLTKEWGLINKILILLLIVISAICVATSKIWMIVLIVFIPTLIHVAVFTIFFMAQGAKNNKSLFGFLNIAIYLLLCVLFFVSLKGFQLQAVSEVIKQVYSSFEVVNIYILQIFSEKAVDPNMVYNSTLGISIMRFIAFAYTYHYLNWFSKVNIINWNQFGKAELIFIIVVWVGSVSLYIYDYKTGIVALFFLSLLHVTLEFPLNFRSLVSLFSNERL